VLRFIDEHNAPLCASDDRVSSSDDPLPHGLASRQPTRTSSHATTYHSLRTGARTHSKVPHKSFAFYGSQFTHRN